MRRLIYLMILPALFLIPAGCTTVQTLSARIGEAAKETTELALVAPERELLKTAAVPADLKLAVAALVMEIRRKPGAVSQVTFDPSGMHRIADPEFDYAGYRWIHWDIDTYEEAASTKNKALVRTTGGLHFADDLGRVTSTAYQLDYETRPGKITITKSAFALLRPQFPQVKAFFVPLDALRKEARQLQSFAAYYAFAAKYALSTATSPEEIAAQQKAAQLTAWEKLKAGAVATGIEGDWAVLVFCMDRLSGDAELTVKVTDTESVQGESLAEAFYFDEAGWRVAVVAGHGRLHSERDRFFVQVLYQPAPDYWAKPVLVGRFGSTLTYPSPSESNPDQGRGIKGTPQAEQQVQEGPLARGERLLNLSVRKDAQLIQTRLAELGYYKSAVDGLFGNASKASLRRFRQDVLGDDSVKWDLDTQKTLFKGTGR